MTNILSGSVGYDIAYRIDGKNILSGSFGYNVAYRIDGKNILSGSVGYDIVYRIDSGVSSSSSSSSDSGEKPGCLSSIIDTIIGAIGYFIVHCLKSWPGRIGITYGLALGILCTIMQHAGAGIGIFLSIFFMLICGALGLLGGFISSKLSRHGNFGALIGAAATGIALVVIGAIGKQGLPSILLFFLIGVVPGLVAGAIIGAIVGLVKKQIDKKK
jgi:hypothetical protein